MSIDLKNAAMLPAMSWQVLRLCLGGEDLPEDQRRFCVDGWRVSDAENREEAIEGRKESEEERQQGEEGGSCISCQG